MEERVFASRDDVVVQLVLTRVKLGLVFALPVGVAWVAALIHRARSRTDPPAFALSAYLAVPLIAGVEAGRRQVFGWRFTNIPADLLVLSSFAELTPDAALTYTALVGLVLWAAVFVRARRAARGR